MIQGEDNNDLDYVVFPEEDDLPNQAYPLPVYKILIVDDEEEVHKITRLTLRDLILDDHELLLLSAYTLDSAKALFASHDDIAVVLIDVVMETNSAGLDLVKHIRDVLKNGNTRIILRTGQPGAAPEEKVIIDYDINDYKSKAELTAQRLLTSVISCIRGYRDIMRIDHNSQVLRRIVDSTSSLFDSHDKPIQSFLNDLLLQLVRFHFNPTGETSAEGFVLAKTDGDFRFSAVTEKYRNRMNRPLHELHDHHIQKAVLDACSDNREKLVLGDHQYVSYHLSFDNTPIIIFIQCETGIEEDMVRVFISTINQALDNFILTQNIEITEREVISTLSEVVEKRDLSTANHIRRVSEFAYIMSRKIGMDHETCNKIKIGCMMHDIGKIGISDQILLKPSELSSDEFERIKEHSRIGHCILKSSPLPVMRVAAEIALAHHERWDGSGYPNGLRGDSIPLNARIISVLDVFDALTHRRIYKEPWPLDDAIDYIRTQSGKMFDPNLVHLFFESIDEILSVWHQYPDEPTKEERSDP